MAHRELDTSGRQVIEDMLILIDIAFGLRRNDGREWNIPTSIWLSSIAMAS